MSPTGWLYVLEIALKIFSVGFDKYWMEGQNQFDFVVTWVIGNRVRYGSNGTYEIF